MKKKKLICVLEAGGLLLLSLSLPAAELVDRIVAVVGDEIITLSDVKSHPSSKDPLETLIREKILKTEMERLGLNASDDELDNAVREVLTRNKITLDSLKSELSRKGIPFDRFKRDLGEQIRQMKFMGQVIFPRIRVSEEEILSKAGPNPSEESRLQARIEILKSRAPDEMEKYLGELRGKTYVEIKK